MKFIQIVTTIDSKKKAEEIAKTLLSKRLAACIQIFPINSSYRWEGKIARAKEWLCLIKARKSDYDKIEAEIKSMHTYSVPEIIAMPIIMGSKSYLKWLEEETA